MPQPAHAPDGIDRANDAFWSEVGPGDLDVAVAPLRPDESFAIDDLTDAEWAEFVRALRE